MLLLKRKIDKSEKRGNKKAVFCFIAFSLLLTGIHAFGQKRNITGTITDSSGRALPGVSVVVKGTKNGTTSDSAGVFSLSAGTGSTLIFSDLGYERKEVKFDGTTTNFNVSLDQASNNLEEVVVIGYGTAKKKDITGAVTTVSSKDFNKGPITDPIQQVVGKVPGLVVTIPSGDPNGAVQMRLRGQTSLTGNQQPLIVVDGVQFPDPNIISTIAPGDIVSYDVLKDASATAIYGARGANGVILIQTKKGRAGKSRVTYNGVLSIDKNAKQLDLLNGPEFTAAGGTTHNYVPGEPTISNGNTDWVDAITRVGLTHSHNIGITGGTKNFSYYASANYLNQKGIVLNTGKEVYGITFNGEQKSLNNRLVIDVGANLSRTKKTFSSSYGSLFYGALKMPPVGSPYDSTGELYAFRDDYNMYNPLIALTMQTNYEMDQTDVWNGSIDYELVKGLKIGGAGSLFFFSYQNHNYTPMMPAYEEFGAYSSGSQGLTNRNTQRGELHVQFNHDYGKHNINATGVYEYNNFTTESFGASGQQYIYDATEDNNLGAGNPAKNSIGSGKSGYKIISFLGRVMYNYDSRYYLTASLRRDGSDKFGSNHQWGYFPSASVAWRINRENFMSSVSWISDLKLNIGWGATGNSEGLSTYQTLLLLGSAGNYYNPSNSSNPYPVTYQPVQNANPDLQWEVRKGWNYSLDFGLFHSRLRGNVNVFNDKTDKLLFNYNVPTPPFFVDNIWANVGSISNKGVEVQLAGDILRKKEFTWNMGGQISFVKTRVASLSGTYDGYNIATDNIALSDFFTGRGGGTNITYLKVGYSPVVFFLPHYVGLDKDGQEQFDNGNGGTVYANGLSTSMYRYTDPAPKFTYGINNTFTYNQWSLNCFLRGTYGQKIYDGTREIVDNIGGLQNHNVTKRGLASGDKTTAYKPSDKWLENASFLRMDNATLSYSFRKISNHIENMQVSFTGNNLFVISKYKGLDPEVQLTSDNGGAYIDNINSPNAYFKTRSFSIGLNVSFE